jgi:cytochrome c553
MRNTPIAIAGIVLVLIGAVGLGAMFVLGGTAMMAGPLLSAGDAARTPDSLGERIYFTGAGEDGPIPRSGGIGHMGSGGCVTCHGADGQGGPVGMMFSWQDAPPIDYDTLTGAHDEHVTDGQSEAWNDNDIARVIRTGTRPNGERINPLMPRWNMRDDDMEALIEYLKTLGEE